MPNKTIFLDWDYLNLPDDLKAEIIDKVKETMVEKFAGTNVMITDNTADFLDLHKGDLAVIRIHNHPGIDSLLPPSEGIIDINTGMGYVSLNDLTATDPISLAEQAGFVACHESGHFFLPEGHSIEQENIMNDGADLKDAFINENGRDLEFTELQKAFLRDEISFDKGIELRQIEAWSNDSLPDADTVDQDIEADNGGDFGNTDDVQVDNGESSPEIDSDIGDIDSDY